MAFLDDISRGITKAGQSAVQKTKNMTDIARLSGLISDEEKNLNNFYNQLGRMYVSMHASDYESEFGGIINSIKEAEKNIASYKQQIQDIKGVVRCVNCGAGNPMAASFCTTCGTPLQKPVENPNPAPAPGIKCNGCGAVLPVGTKFCTNCGTPLTEEPPAPAEPIEIKKICPNCNESMMPEAAFCTNCGTKINS